MKYAIIAAGNGQRLNNEGIEVPKPLVKVGGEHLIDRLIRIFADNDADEICVICNAGMPDVVSHLEHVALRGLRGRRVPLRYIARQTPSSMHSLHELRPLLGQSAFVLTTVDTVFREQEFARYVTDFRALAAKGEGLMGVTNYVDDEKPLYVECALDAEKPQGIARITGFFDEEEDCRYVSAGIYALPPVALRSLEACVERGERRMRNFQRALVADEVPLWAWPFTKVLDVDHASDIAKAEAFLNET